MVQMGSIKELFVDSPNVVYKNDCIEATYEYTTTKVQEEDSKIVVRPEKTKLMIRTERAVPRVGVMLVGWGGNNGTTFTAAVLANKAGLMLESSRRGAISSNWYGSLTQASTVELGEGVHHPLGRLLPTVNPDDLVIDGWDISSMDLGSALDRAAVLKPSLRAQLRPFMSKLRPRPSPHFPDFIASNQADRVNNVLKGSKWEQLETIREDMRRMKNKVDKVIVLWTANTERFCSTLEGVNDTGDNLLSAIKCDHPEVSPSTLFAVAAILEGCPYINGSPQNTFVSGCLELAESCGVPLVGDDLKSGQTKLKSVLVDFLVGAGIKPVAITSYNHLGNNDGKNLSEPSQFKSKEITKSNVVDDVIASNPILYKPGEKIDHTVVIKYVPYVGDSKRAMDEYLSEIMLGGESWIVVHNVCEDSLLAAPIMADLVVLTELTTRITFSSENHPGTLNFLPALSLLAYLCKAPLVPRGAPVVNALMKQRQCLVNILRACLALPPDHNMGLEYKLPSPLFTSKPT